MQNRHSPWAGSAWSGACLLSLAFLVCAPMVAQQQAALVDAPAPALPDPQAPSAAPAPNPCPQDSSTTGVHPSAAPCARKRPNFYVRFTNGPKDKPLTVLDKGWLATRNAVDPFNAITILGEAGISVASDSHSPFGPGMPGYARYVGVSYTQDLIGEFFGTFAIPAVTHQDPHYHRMPHGKIPRRAWHSVAQVFWTQGDSGRMMPNYANLVGFGIDDELSNLFVPGRETNGRASAERWATGLATAPIGNVVNEFLPDIASHIHVQIVIVQRIINQVARTETGNNASE